jgi:dTDP-glucose 4,6-dehydratase
MRILVTGGCGFIGSHFIKHVLKKYPDYHVVNLDKLDVCSSLHNVDECDQFVNYKFIKGDITSADLLNYILKTEHIEVIVHAAAQSHVDASFGNSMSFTQNNVYGTHVLLEAAKSANVKKFLHVSTDEVYGSCDEDCKDEKSAPNPTNPYSASKAAAENLVMAYINSFAFPALITRGNNVYGPHQYVENLIPKFIIRLLRGEMCCVHGDGNNRRHYLHVNDTVNALDLVLHKGSVGEIYNIGSNEEFTTLEVAAKLIGLIKKTANVQDWIEHVPDRPFNDSRYFLSFTKLNELGWEPKENFNASIVDIIKWYQTVDLPTYWSKRALSALDPHPL